MKYFIDAVHGHDLASGSIQLPWRTLERANRQSFNAGDELFLRGDQDHTGHLIFESYEDLKISSYGEGRATIIPSSQAAAILIRNSRGIRISELNARGPGAGRHRTHGVCVFAESHDAGSIELTRMDVSGFGLAGIALGGALGYGLDTVLIDDVDSHDNGYAGIFSWSDGLASPHKNITIRQTRVFENAGVPGLLHPSGKGIHSGHGILLSGVTGGLIEKCRAFENGKKNIANLCGPAGIWASHGERIIIRDCESIRNHTAGAADGGGFGLDGGVSNSILENNLSQENDGPGFLLARYFGAEESRGNRVIGNRSLNDGRKNDNGSIHIWAAEGFPIKDAVIAQNQIYLNEKSGGRPRALMIQGPVENFEFSVNTISAPHSVSLMDVNSLREEIRFDLNILNETLFRGFLNGERLKEMTGWSEVAPDLATN